LKLDINKIKKQCQKIHFFGLGFIQLKLNERERLHFYTTKFSSIISDLDVHNHRYDFTSQVLKGELRSYQYLFEPNNSGLGAYTKEFESCNPDIKIDKRPVNGDIKHNGNRFVGVDEQYFMDHTWFHKVRVEKDTITYLQRSEYKKEAAEVIRHNLSELVCPFSKQVPEEELWSIVENMIEEM
jgi:hypothetical protein